MGQYLVIAALVGAVSLAVRSMWRDHKSGKSCCGGSCAACGKCHACHPEAGR